MAINIKGLELSEGDSFFMVIRDTAQKYTVKSIDGDTVYLSIWFMGELELGPFTVQKLNEEDKEIVRTRDEANALIKTFLTGQVQVYLEELYSCKEKIHLADKIVLQTLYKAIRGSLASIHEGDNQWGEK